MRVRYYFWLAILIVFAWASFVIWSQPSFQECIDRYQSKEAASQKYKEHDGLPYSPVLYAVIDTACGAHFLHENEGTVTAFATIVIAFFTLTLWRSTDKLWVEAIAAGKTAVKAANAAKAAADATRDQVSLSTRPKVVVRHVHIWSKGDGALLNPGNRVPDFVPGELIEGAALAINVGGEDATVIDSDCTVFWCSGPLTMNHPLWGHKPMNELRRVKWPQQGGHLISSGDEEPRVINPGATYMWDLSAKVPEDKSLELHIIGIVNYRDRLNTRRSTSFARQYDKVNKRFDESKDNNYEEAQ